MNTHTSNIACLRFSNLFTQSQPCSSLQDEPSKNILPNDPPTIPSNRATSQAAPKTCPNPKQTLKYIPSLHRTLTLLALNSLANTRPFDSQSILHPPLQSVFRALNTRRQQLFHTVLLRKFYLNGESVKGVNANSRLSLTSSACLLKLNTGSCHLPVTGCF
jgi:hypothetical protein